MRRYSYVHCDVFTDRPFGGNPLVVFPEAEGLSYDEMLALAREINHSETTFVFPATTADAQRKVRIFTPQREIPFAGHPLIGTAMVLAVDQGISSDNGQNLRLQLKSGSIEVDFSDTEEGAYSASLALGQPEVGVVAKNHDLMCRAIGITVEDLDDIAPPQVFSVGLPWLFLSVPVARVIENMKPVAALLRTVTDEVGAVGIYAFSMEAVDDDADITARAFAPSLGVLEDPATGSAAAALGGYLVHHRFLGDGAFAALRIAQGKELGRPSRILVHAHRGETAVDRVKVGGQVALFGRGDFVL